MFNKILETIESENKIIIIRHKNPDLDAFGSQIGLFYSLKEKYPDKEIYKVGDDNGNNIFNVPMDKIDDSEYEDSLVILVDQSSLYMLNDENILKARKSIIMDHHENNPDFADIVLIKNEYSSASELISEFIIKMGFPLNAHIAKFLYSGIVGDSNRFYYKGTSSNTFEVATKLLETGLDIGMVYKAMEKEELENEKRFKGHVLSNFIVNGPVAYVYISKETLKEFGVSPFYSARGTVNQLASIKGIKAFVNFTEIPESGEILTEIRGRELTVLDIAIKYGGGGHKLACGCTLRNKDLMNPLIDDLVKEMNKNE